MTYVKLQLQLLFRLYFNIYYSMNKGLNLKDLQLFPAQPSEK